jgi:branched-chain amino acid aminotransferase
MQETESIWMDGKLVPWADAKVHVLAHSLHYGDGAFEGIRAYKTDQGPAVFRLTEHVDRLFYSAQALGMELPYAPAQVCNAICDTLRANKLEEGYVRPLAIHGYGVMGVNPRNSPVQLIIACWPWGAYLPVEAANIKVSRFIRIHPDSTVADAKICGHYVNSIMAILELRGTKYDEALFLDSNGNIAEGPGENFFMVKNREIITPPLGAILAGITRATVLEIASERGFAVTERPISLAEAVTADEAFFSGTACEITPIGIINDQMLGNGKPGPVSLEIKSAYLDAVRGRTAAYRRFLTFVENRQ